MNHHSRTSLRLSRSWRSPVGTPSAACRSSSDLPTRRRNAYFPDLKSTNTARSGSGMRERTAKLSLTCMSPIPIYLAGRHSRSTTRASISDGFIILQSFIRVSGDFLVRGTRAEGKLHRPGNIYQKIKKLRLRLLQKEYLKRSKLGRSKTAMTSSCTWRSSAIKLTEVRALFRSKRKTDENFGSVVFSTTPTSPQQIEKPKLPRRGRAFARRTKSLWSICVASMKRALNCDVPISPSGFASPNLWCPNFLLLARIQFHRP